MQCRMDSTEAARILWQLSTPSVDNPTGVANILSSANVTKHYRVTMDSATSTAMLIHRSDGSVIKFEPSGNGLYQHKLPSDMLAVNTMWSMLSTSVSTVSNNATNYSKCAYQRDVEARRLQNIVMQPASKLLDESAGARRACGGDGREAWS